MLLYSVIARSSDGVILAEATTGGVEGNHQLAAQQLIQALVRSDHLVTVGNRITYAHVASKQYTGSDDGDGDKYFGLDRSDSGTLENFFHVQRDESVYFVCISDDKDSQRQRVNYGYLLEVQKIFMNKFPPNKIIKANAYSFDKALVKTLSNLMHHYNTNNHYGSDLKSSQLNAQVESIKKHLDVNIDLLMRRGMKMEELVQRSDDLLEESMVFHTKSNKLKKVMKRKSLYYKLILGGFALLTLYLMMVKLCGFDLSCKAEKNDGNYYN